MGGQPAELDEPQELADLTGQIFGSGRYRLASQLGVGGMGAVYRATDTRLRRDVALKILHPELVAHPTARRRMTQEAEALARIEHPNVVRVIDVFDEGPMLVMVLEFVTGGDLAAKIADGELPEAEVVPLMVGILAGLQAIHDAGLVHRDMKPGNVLLTDKGVPKITDLGVARDLQAKDKTRAGAMMGTPEYMSPEQVKGLGVDARSDIYSAGIVLFELLTGRKPYEATSEFDIAVAHVTVAPNLGLLRGKASAGRIAVVGKALAKAPEERFESAKAMLEALRRAGPSLAARAERSAPPIEGHDESQDRTPKGLMPLAARSRPASNATANAASARMPATTSKDDASTLPPGGDCAEPAVAGPPSARRWVMLAVVAGLLAVVGISAVVLHGGQPPGTTTVPPIMGAVGAPAKLVQAPPAASAVALAAVVAPPAGDPPSAAIATSPPTPGQPQKVLEVLPVPAIGDARSKSVEFEVAHQGTEAAANAERQTRIEREALAWESAQKTAAAARVATTDKAPRPMTTPLRNVHDPSPIVPANGARNPAAMPLNTNPPPSVPLATRASVGLAAAPPRVAAAAPAVAPGAAPAAMPPSTAERLAEACKVACNRYAGLAPSPADVLRVLAVCQRRCPRAGGAAYRLCIGTVKDWKDMGDCD